MFQEHPGFDGCLFGDFEAAREEYPFGFRLFFRVRIIEEAEAEFECQDPAHGVIYAVFGDLAFSHEVFEMLHVEVVDHVHVQTCVDGIHGCGLPVFRHALIYELDDCVPVCHDEAVMSPFFLEDICHGVAVCGAGSTADVVEGAHEGGGSCLDAGFERRKICIPECLAGDFRRYVVAAGFGCAVADIVLKTGGYVVRLREVVALICLHGSCAEYRCQVRVFSIAFGNTAPARVSGNVDHRRECPVDTGIIGFLCCHATGLAGKFRVPCGAECQRDRIYCPETVYDIEAEEDRDSESGAFDSFFLHSVPELGIVAEVDQGAGFARDVGHYFVKVVHVVVPAEGVLVQLGDFFLQCHAGHQVCNSGVDGKGGVLVWRQLLFFRCGLNFCSGRHSGSYRHCIRIR